MNNIPKVKVKEYWRETPRVIRLAPTRWQLLKFRVRQFIRFMTISTGVLGAFILSATIIGAEFFSTTTMTHANERQNVIVEVPVKASILERIADCESGNGVAGSNTSAQFDKNGQLITHVNMTGIYAGTVDAGKYGINLQIWGKQAGKLGFNIATLEGNTSMANYLYENYGTEPWAGTSGKCWKK